MLKKDLHQAQDSPMGDCFHLRDQCDLQDTADLGAGQPAERSTAARACSDCMLLAQSLNAARLETRPMADHLVERLRAVANTQPLDVEQNPMEPPTGDTLESAARDLLNETIAQSRRSQPMPPSLADSLKAIARNEPADRAPSDGPTKALEAPAKARASLPWWLADSNWATAACALLTAALMLVAGDSSARFQDLTRIKNLNSQDLKPAQSLSQIQNLAPDLASVQDLMRFAKLPAGPATTDEPAQPTAPQAGPGLLASAQATGTGIWTGIRDRVVARVSPWIGHANSRIEALRIATDAWLGTSSRDTASTDTTSKNNATLGPEQLRELELRAQEAWKNDSKPTPEAGRTRQGKEAP